MIFMGFNKKATQFLILGVLKVANTKKDIRITPIAK
jgi:hypothetical protein